MKLFSALCLFLSPFLLRGQHAEFGVLATANDYSIRALNDGKYVPLSRPSLSYGLLYSTYVSKKLYFLVSCTYTRLNYKNRLEPAEPNVSWSLLDSRVEAGASVFLNKRTKFRAAGSVILGIIAPPYGKNTPLLNNDLVATATVSLQAGTGLSYYLSRRLTVYAGPSLRFFRRNYIINHPHRLSLTAETRCTFVL